MDGLKTALMIMFHPIRGFTVIKEKREDFNYTPTLILFILILMARFIDIYYTHYPLSKLNPRETNLWTEFARMLIPLFTWTIGCYAMTTINEGKTVLKEQLASTAYAMLPYIVLTPIIALLSHFMSAKNSGLFYRLQFIKWAWVIILFFISTATMNEYKFWKTVGVCMLGILSVVIIWLLIGLFYSLGDQIVVFAKELVSEIKLLNSR